MSPIRSGSSPPPRRAGRRARAGPRRRAAVEVVIDGQPTHASRPARRFSTRAARWASTRPRSASCETLTPVNVCRVCVVEVAGSRALVPACSRRSSPGWTIRTDSERVRAVAADGARAPGLVGRPVDRARAQRHMRRYGAQPERYGPPPRRQPRASATRASRPSRRARRHAAETVAQPVKVDNDLYVRDYSKCILCYKCVEACGVDAQNTFAIAVAGRGFDARISTESDVPLPDSACVYCGNCIGVCPTGALMFKQRVRHAAGRDLGRVEADADRHDLPLLRRRLHAHAARPGQPDREGHVAADVSVTGGHLCIKGRFGFTFVEPSSSKDAPGA